MIEPVKTPIIGITTYGADQANRYGLPIAYVSAVQRAGGQAVLIPPGGGDPARYLEILDGLVLAGGGDIDPKHYGGVQHPKLYGIDVARDELELALAHAVTERDWPTLGVCRGMQVLNVALGGTLIEHLPDEVGEDVLHRALPRDPTPHAVHIEAGSKLAVVAGSTEAQPLSWHHQGIRKLADSLRAVARAPDGTIEAVEHPDRRWLMAVQWHPELSAHEDPAQQRLFDALVAEARRQM